MVGIVLTGAVGTIAAANPQEGRNRSVYRVFLRDRTLDGSENNLLNPEQGMAGTAFTRVAEAAYADEFNAMESGPNPRFVSNRIYNDNAENIFSENGVTHWGFVWGQFIDHTLACARRETSR